ncbi:MAG: hypothetical protein K9N46_00065 [Candidatus Marinimicrobia bacterium]|nr:hypothetical protein [Candidatus Neomarinimicrobiota bacterium]MCF7829924.1 hypothetical protein [Candidatus Neomarinimicrobiota bacterium]MCF7879113.1 hypothetical protein [Candidatus Neomarinimicrobiota bacterium]
MNLQLEFLLNYHVEPVELFGGFYVNNLRVFEVVRLSQVMNYKLGFVLHATPESEWVFMLNFPGKQTISTLTKEINELDRLHPYFTISYRHTFGLSKK